MKLEKLDREMFETKIRPIITCFKNIENMALRGNNAICNYPTMGIFKKVYNIEVPQFIDMITLNKANLFFQTKPGDYYLCDNSLICHESTLYTIRPIDVQVAKYDIAAADSRVSNETISMPITYQVNDVLSDPAFKVILEMKATDGVQHYTPTGSNYYMTLYSGILNFIKSDKIRLDIFDNGTTLFIARFTVEKKTGVKIETYIRYLKIRGSR